MCLSLQHITKKLYNRKTQNGTYTFAFLSVAIATLFYIAISFGKLDFSFEVVGYSVLFSITYSLAAVMSLLAINNGPLSLTSLITAFSLIVPTLYGLIILNETITPTLIFGLILLAVCLILIKFDGGVGKISWKWATYVTLAFLGNGICSTVQKVQQIHSNGMYKSEFMVIALSLASVILFIFAICFERKTFIKNSKSGFACYTLCGLGNGVVNMLVMAISLSVASSVMFPIMSVGSITLTTALSVILFKERLSLYQWLGVLSGLISIVFLNL